MSVVDQAQSSRRREKKTFLPCSFYGQHKDDLLLEEGLDVGYKTYLFSVRK